MLANTENVYWYQMPCGLVIYSKPTSIYFVFLDISVLEKLPTTVFQNYVFDWEAGVKEVACLEIGFNMRKVDPAT